MTARSQRSSSVRPTADDNLLPWYFTVCLEKIITLWFNFPLIDHQMSIVLWRIYESQAGCTLNINMIK